MFYAKEVKEISCKHTSLLVRSTRHGNIKSVDSATYKEIAGEEAMVSVRGRNRGVKEIGR